jgi:hypothetical protein
MFFFKPKVIHLDCFTYRRDVYEHFSIEKTHKFFPDWWKKTEKRWYNDEEFWGISTIKSCVGLNNFFANGVTIPLWSDLAVNINLEKSLYRWQFGDNCTTVGRHATEQLGGYLDPSKYVHFKIDSPWSFECEEDINWMWVQNTWTFKEPSDIIISPGIIDFKYQSTTNINMFFNLPTNDTTKNIMLYAGQPMVNIVPMSERKVKIHTHFLNKDEWENRKSKNSPRVFLNGFYNKSKEISKKRESQSKCPFGFK